MSLLSIFTPFLVCEFHDDLLENKRIGVSYHPGKKTKSSLAKSLHFWAFFSVQYVQCVHDDDTDEMVWWPPTVDTCSGIIFLIIFFLIYKLFCKVCKIYC